MHHMRWLLPALHGPGRSGADAAVLPADRTSGVYALAVGGDRATFRACAGELSMSS